MACAGYESDDRRGSTSPEVRALVCEDHGCCFVPRPDGVIMTDFRERECYAPPPRDDADWISMSYGECSAQCAALDDDARPFQVRPLSCTHANGTLARNALCPLVRPESIRSCNTREECPPQACSLTRGATSCANGACEKHYHDTKPWIYDYKCTCLNGWTRGETGACDVQIPRCLGLSLIHI